MKEKMKVNKSLLIGWAVLVVVLLLAYTVEFIKGERTLIYYIVFILLDIVPFIVTFLLYRQNNESSILQYITAFGYSGLYVFVLLTGDTPMVFVYILPMLSLLLLCTNMNLLLGLTSTITNLIQSRKRKRSRKKC